MKAWIAATAAGLMATQAYAADVATCTLSADRKTVTVTATNPYSEVMACEVNCDMALPGGISTVVCTKPVPVGAKDFVMCTQKADGDRTWTRVKGASVNCPDPAAPPPKAEKADDDDAKIEATMEEMVKQGQQMLERMKRK